jgi:hypothetical protein
VKSADLKKGVPNPSPGRISVRTPPPIAAITSRPNLNPQDILIGNPTEFHAPQAYFGASLTHQPPVEMAFVEEPLYGIDADMEMEPEIGANFCKVPPKHGCVSN